MARRKQFSQLITALRSELKQNSDPAVGAANLPTLMQAIQRNYESLWDECEWPHLNQTFDPEALSAGQQYYDFDDVDYDKIECVVIWWNGQPTPLVRGIGFGDYAQFRSSEDERSDPAIKWDVRFTGTKEQIEIWPLPASDDQEIQIQGKLRFRQLVNDADLCLLDDHLVVLRAAASLASTKDKGEIQRKMGEAEKRLGIIKMRAATGGETVRIGLGKSNRPIYGKSVVRVRG